MKNTTGLDNMNINFYSTQTTDANELEILSQIKCSFFNYFCILFNILSRFNANQPIA